ncbi:GtrA family protein [Nonomuraea sp. NPDC000554]|uniref:GtrA family protein n=1 Tax=Nonomuraea sp. NPDC000554 TaxID=3154259 RepID=UPI003332BDC5
MVEVESRATYEDKSHFGWRALLPVLDAHRVIYLMAGAMTAAIHCGLLGLALHAAQGAIPYLVLVVVSHFGTVVLVYPWYRLVVFRGSKESWVTGYLRFYLVGLSFLFASLIGLPILVEVVGLPVLVAQGLIVVISPPITYLIHRNWTFRAHGNV